MFQWNALSGDVMLNHDEAFDHIHIAKQNMNHLTSVEQALIGKCDFK